MFPAERVRRSSLGWMLKTTATHLDKTMTEALKPLGLNLSQFAIIMTLLEGDGLTQVEIGKKIAMPGYATTRNIDALEQNGFLERQQHATSRRSFSIKLTEKGRSLAPNLFSTVEQVNNKVFETIEENDLAFLKEIMTKIVAKL